MDADLLETFVAEVRGQTAPADEGSVWALFVGADGRPVLATSVDGHRDEPHALAYLLANVGAHSVVVAVVRRGGAALEADRALVGALRTIMAGETTRLADALVVGPYGWQSLGDAGIAAEGVA